jgi:3-oxoacyl-[acyl-carrier protein] reductase
VNLRGVFLANRAVLPAMRAQGTGHIVNVCSSTTPRGLRGTPFGPAYCASKFGVVGLTEALAAEVGTQGIRVQAIFPGPVTTPLVDQTLLARPFGGAISAEAFADAVVALLETPRDAMLRHPHVLPFRGAFPEGAGETTG